jgi:hypothetical protein
VCWPFSTFSLFKAATNMNRGHGYPGSHSGGLGEDYSYVAPESEPFSGGEGGGIPPVSIGVPGMGGRGQPNGPQLIWDGNVGLFYDSMANLHFDNRANLHVDASSGTYYDLMNGLYQDQSTGQWLPMYGESSYSPSSPYRGMERQWSQESDENQGYDEDDFQMNEVEALMEQDLRHLAEAEEARLTTNKSLNTNKASNLKESHADVEIIAPDDEDEVDTEPSLPPFAHEIWFPECRDCSCCAGFKHGCKCCTGKSKSCKHPGCVRVPDIAPAPSVAPKLNSNASVFQPKVAACTTTQVDAGVQEKDKVASATGSTVAAVPSSVAQYDSEYDIVAND